MNEASILRLQSNCAKIEKLIAKAKEFEDEAYQRASYLRGNRCNTFCTIDRVDEYLNALYKAKDKFGEVYEIAKRHYQNGTNYICESMTCELCVDKRNIIDEMNIAERYIADADAKRTAIYTSVKEIVEDELRYLNERVRGIGEE